MINIININNIQSNMFVKDAKMQLLNYRFVITSYRTVSYSLVVDEDIDLKRKHSGHPMEFLLVRFQF